MSICMFSCSDNKKTDDISEKSSTIDNIPEESSTIDNIPEESSTTDDIPEKSSTQEENIEEICSEITENFKKYISNGDVDGLLELCYPSDVLETAKTIAEIEDVDYLEYTDLDEMCDNSNISDVQIDEVISIEPLDSETLEEINFDFSGVYALAEYIEKTGIENITPETLYEKYMEEWSVSTTITKGYEIEATETITYKNKRAETGLQATLQLYYVDGEGWKMYADQ